MSRKHRRKHTSGKTRRKRQNRESRLRDGKQKRLELVLKAGGICCVATCQWTLSCALEFHHRDPNEKRFTLDSWTLGAIEDKKLIEEEAKKCILLCSNHHKMFHAGLLVIQCNEY